MLPSKIFVLLSLASMLGVFGFAPPTVLLSGSKRSKAALSSSSLKASLKPAAVPLMDSGKALARSGELLIEVTSALDLYGGGLSAAGAQIRNAGDCVAQAAASCRFKTARELVCDEMREAATCLTEATDKLQLAIQEAESDKDEALARKIEPLVSLLGTAGETLEAAGACIMKGLPESELGSNMVECGKALEGFSTSVVNLSPDNADCQLCSQRMAYAAETMIKAGQELQGTKAKPTKGKGWLKG